MEIDKIGNELLEKLSAKLLEYSDVESICSLYHVANKFKKSLEDIMKTCRNLINAHMLETGEMKGRVSTGTWGMTQPKPQRVLNSEKWRNALDTNHELYEIESNANWAIKRLENAQKAFMEEVIPEGRVYIK